MESKEGKFSLPACVACKKRILGNFIGALGKHWHPEHFNCCICQKNIVGCFYHNAEEIYCKEHFKLSVSPKCGCCNQPTMDEPNVVAFGKHWIISHFMCHYMPCKKPIKATDVFYLHENKPFCTLEHINEVKTKPQDFYHRVPPEKMIETQPINIKPAGIQPNSAIEPTGSPRGSAIQMNSANPKAKVPAISPRQSFLPASSAKPSNNQLTASISPRLSSSPGPLTSVFQGSPTTSPRNQSNSATMPIKLTSPRANEPAKQPSSSGSNISLKEEFGTMVSISKKLPETEKQLANLAQNPSKEEVDKLLSDIDANLVCMVRLREQFFGPDIHEVARSKEQVEKLQTAANQIFDQLTRQKQQLLEHQRALLAKEPKEEEIPKSEEPQICVATENTTVSAPETEPPKVIESEQEKPVQELSGKENQLSEESKSLSSSTLSTEIESKTTEETPETPELREDLSGSRSMLYPPTQENRNSKGIEIIKSWENKKKVLKDRSLIVHVLEGRNLPAKDITGTSDPYCKVNLNGQIFQTGVIWKNLNPFWGEEFRFKVTEMDSTTRITFTVKDKDKASNDDLMGVLDIGLKPLEDQQMREQWWSLNEAEDLNYDISGDLHLQLILDTSSTPNKLNVKIVEARNIAAVSTSTGTSDPFVEIRSPNEKPKRTTVSRKTTAPKWQESFVFFVSDLSTPFLFHMYHSSLLGNNFMGEVTIVPKDLVHNKLVDNFFMLRHRTKEKKSNCGEVRLRLKYVETKIIQLQAYDVLLDLIMDTDFIIIKSLGEVTSEKEAVATILTNIFSTKGRLESLLTHLTQVEINNQVESTTLFRGNSLTTKSVDVSMKLVGQKYLEKTIGPHINLIYSVQPDIELDPAKLKPGANSKKSLQALNELCEKFCNSIFNSVDNCPMQMRAVFHALQQQVTEKFPNEPECRYTAVAGFLFLRFFCAAILGPKLFFIAPEHPAKKVARTLTLIAKVIQNLANLSDFGPKEPHMKLMNPFISANMNRLKNFIDTVSTIPPGANPGSEPPIFLEKECYLLYHHLVLNKVKLMPVLESHSPEKRVALEKVLDHLKKTYDL